MDAGKLSICGEESFGTGSDHIREKDGIWYLSLSKFFGLHTIITNQHFGLVSVIKKLGKSWMILQ